MLPILNSYPARNIIAKEIISRFARKTAHPASFLTGARRVGYALKMDLMR